jgi:predicted dehydrogenase
MSRRQTTRRSFMKRSAAAAGAGFFVWNQRTYAQSKSPNEKVSIAWIGIGGQGSSDVNVAGEVGHIAAICDVDENRLADKGEKFTDAEQFIDYREMIDKLGDKIDAVGVTTPDHHHVPAAMLAMKKGKHVHCQKPLTHSVWEARQMRETAAKMKLKTQMGNQGSASEGLRKGAEWIRAGVIGSIKEIHVWTNRPVWPQAPGVVQRPPAMDPPKYLHWDLWLGQAPQRPYAEYEGNPDKGKKDRKGAYHPFNWRGWWDFGTGALGDMACHTANLPFFATKLKYPTRVTAEAGDVNPETYPSWAHIIWHYPARESQPELKFHWYEGRKDGKLVQPDQALFTGPTFDDDKNKFPGGGALIIGDKGAMFQYDDYGRSWRLLPETRFKDEKGPEPTLPRNNADNIELGMKKEWIAAIRGEIDQPFSNFGYAGLLTEAMLLGNVAIRNHGKQLDWDGEAMKFKSNDEANKSLRRQPRAGWDVMA